ncbi:urease accessory protein UreF [Rhodobacteraceae bacterium CCMM004]|nr:urease accessory protein UreF [Rhodobacteraceae bacterium CCMM004]
MTDDWLTLMQWLSPAFPVGGFAYSHGLEAAMASGDVGDAAALERWLDGVLRHGAGRSDAVLLCAAMAPGARLGDLADLARALAAGAERWTETRDQGAAFAAAVRGLGVAVPDLPMPVAVGAAARTLSLPPQGVAAAYLQAFAAGLVSAAVRWLAIGAVPGQRVLAGCRPAIAAASAAAPGTRPEDIATAVPAADLGALLHETLQPRQFRS